jgi:hypothetical protein
MMSESTQPRECLYPAVFSPLDGKRGRWRVRFPDLEKEDQITSDALQEAILKASVFLKQYLTAFDRNWRNLPSPSSYEDVPAGKGETVQFIFASRDVSKKTWREGFFFGILFCCIALFLFCLWIMQTSPRFSIAAEAANIIGELRNLKAAAFAYKEDHPDALSSLSEGGKHIALLLHYLDNPEKVRERTSYTFRVANGVWWVGYNVDKETSELREKLEGKAQSVGLFGSPSIDEPPASYDVGHLYKKDAEAIWLLIDPASMSNK